MISLPGGGALVAWLDSRHVAGQSIYAQRIMHGGRTIWSSDGVPLCTAPGLRGPLSLASDGSEGAYVAWGDSRPQGELFATRVTGDGAPAPGWPIDGALVSEWQPTTYTFDRGFGGLDLTAIGGGRAVVAWQDVRQVPGIGIDADQAFAMLLAPDGPAVSTPLAHVARMPARPASQSGRSAQSGIALRSLGPNPGRRGSLVRFALPEAGPAALELFDLAGRRRWSLDVGSFGPGEHEVALGGGSIPPGVYVARLTQGDHKATMRIAVLP